MKLNADIPEKLNMQLDSIPKIPCSYPTQNIFGHGQEIITMEQFYCNECEAKDFEVFFPREDEDYSILIRCKNCGMWYRP